MMDGYAVAEGAAGRRLRVAGEIAAGRAAACAADANCCVEIMTGAPCPPNTYAVVQKEQVTRSDDLVSMPDRVAAGQHIAPKGSECRAGQILLPPGRQIDPFALAVLATVGKTHIKAIPRPRLGIVSTGTELVRAEERPEPFQIRDCNGIMLAAMAQTIGLAPATVLISPDDTNAILDSFRALEHCDIIIVSGGVSAGRYDLVPDALAQYGADVIFHKVSQKPGKPLLAARRGSQLIFGLPGNPLACHLGFHRYVAAAIRKMQGLNPDRPVFFAQLAQAADRTHERTYFMPGIVETPATSDRLPLLRTLPGKSSADIFQSAGANCYAEIQPGPAPAAAGEVVPFTFLDAV
jgi:molybdopterin molybdotransferase